MRLRVLAACFDTGLEQAKKINIETLRSKGWILDAAGTVQSGIPFVLFESRENVSLTSSQNSCEPVLCARPLAAINQRMNGLQTGLATLQASVNQILERLPALEEPNRPGRRGGRGG